MSFRYALKQYVETPERFPTVVLYFDRDVTIIWDKYPKSVIHLLILPRDAIKTKQIPIIAFDDLKFKQSMEPYIEKGVLLAQREFKKRWKPKKEDRRNDQIHEYPNIKVLCHAVPSLNNLHIHIITDDFYSKSLKNKKHYNSFQEPFGIPFNNFPLKEDDPIRDKVFAEMQLKKDLKCGDKEYGSRFVKLKSDLDESFKSHWERT